MSPIHDQSYRRYGGDRNPVGRAWSVIAVAGIRSMLARKWFWGVLLASWFSFIGHVIWFYGVVVLPQASQILPVKADAFGRFLEWQGTFVFFVAVFAGSGLVATDRRANALQIYLSKPVTRLEYIAGKLAILVTFLTFITLVPALLLVVFLVAFAGNVEFLRQNLFVIPAIILSSTIRVLVPALAMLALSSLSKSTRFVAIMFAGIIFFSEAIFGVLTVITGSTRVAWVSVGANINNLSDMMFRQAPRYETPAIVSILVLLGLIVVSISVLERRIRGVEVVA